jgi:hypothetical protein
MTDFLTHLVDAPLANILIVAGLVFLGVGAVGKVVGKIEPDRLGRVIAGLLGVVLLAAGFAIHIQGNKSAPSPASVQPVIRVFTINPLEITKGSKVTIHWEVSDADDVLLEPFGQVPLVGDKVVEPWETTIFKLDATNKTGGKSGTFQQVLVNSSVVTPIPKPLVKRGPDKPETSKAETANDGTTSGSPPDEKPVYASQAPPALQDQDYDQPPDPGGNSAWTPGSWYFDVAKGSYYWVPGAWITPPTNLVWTPPYWEYEAVDRYRWYPGYWAARVGFYGGIDYGFGYTGKGYYRSKERSRTGFGCNGGLHRPKKRPSTEEVIPVKDRLPPISEQVKLVNKSHKDGRFFGASSGHPNKVAELKPPTPVKVANDENQHGDFPKQKSGLTKTDQTTTPPSKNGKDPATKSGQGNPQPPPETKKSTHPSVVSRPPRPQPAKPAVPVRQKY